MARSRNIKPGFFQNEVLAEMEFSTRLLFIGLWTEADRDGKLEDRPRKIKMAIFPADNVDVDKMLTTLHNGELITRYRSGALSLIKINKWAKHQSPHHTEKQSILPDNVESPVNNATLTVKERDQDGGNPPDSLIPDSLIPEPLIKDIDDSGESKAEKSTCKASEVFEHWKVVMSHPRAVLDEKRIKLIRKWLRAGYSAETLMDSITGYTHSPHHMGQNDRNTKYDGLELILRDAGHIDAGLKHLELSKSKGENNHGVKIYHGNQHQQLEQWRQNKSAELAEAAERAEAEIALLSKNGN